MESRNNYAPRARIKMKKNIFWGKIGSSHSIQFVSQAWVTDFVVVCQELEKMTYCGPVQHIQELKKNY